MRIETALNHERRFKSHVREIFSIASISGLSHERILEMRQERVLDDDAWDRVPGWVHSRVSEMFTNLSDALHTITLTPSEITRYGAEEAVRRARYIKWQLRVDGKFVTSNEVSEMRKAGDEEVWSRVEGAHIWNHNNNPFNPWQGLHAVVAAWED